MSGPNRAPEMNPDLTPDEVEALIERMDAEWYERAEVQRLDAELREAA